MTDPTIPNAQSLLAMLVNNRHESARVNLDEATRTRAQREERLEEARRAEHRALLELEAWRINLEAVKRGSDVHWAMAQAGPVAAYDAGGKIAPGFDASNVDVAAARATPDPYPTASWQSQPVIPQAMFDQIEEPRTHVFIRRIDEKAFRENWTGGGRLVFHSTEARAHEGHRYGPNDSVIVDMANAGAGLADVIRRSLTKCGLTWEKTVTEIEP